MKAMVTLAIGLVSAGCVSEFEDATSLIREERILAVRGIPAEVRPGEAVRYEALVATPDGRIGSALQFSYCTKARSAEERTGITASCLVGENLQRIPLEAEMPADACARFGPNTPPAEGGEPARRPSDPDPTGGYHIPVVATADDGGELQSIGFHRIRCDLAGATRDIFEAFQERYRENRHPAITDVVMAAGEDEKVTLQLRVPASSFEDYVVYSANDSALFDAQETLTAHWFVSAGTLTASRTTVDPTSGSAAVRWSIADGDTSLPKLWVIVRDSRGGSVWSEYSIEL